MNKKIKILLLVILISVPFSKAYAQSDDNYKLIKSEKEGYILEYELMSRNNSSNEFIVGETLESYGVRAKATLEERFISSFSSWDNPNYVIQSGWQEVVVSTKTPVDGKFNVVLSIFGNESENSLALTSKTNSDPIVSSIVLSSYNITLDVGASYDLNINDIDNISSVAWTSTNTKIAKVNKASGVVTGISEGNTIIKCTLTTIDNKNEVIEANITVGHNGITPILTANELDLSIGETYDINIENKISKSTYLWTSSDKAVTKVKSSNGVVTALKSGVANIYCTIITPNKDVFVLKCEVTVE